ncbi:MAG: hypothetical protein O9353_01100 [Bacteroidia bacterium]|nr:hypothetical protein [Bacteroidia bacterium]
MFKSILASIAVCSTLSTFAQKSFEQNTNVIAFGADLGLYNYTSKVATNPRSTASASLNKTLSLHYERGVLNWLGIGAKVGISDYFTETDSITGNKAKVQAIDASLLVNAHFVRAKYVDMLGGFNIGYSHMNYSAGDEFISNAKGGGLMYDIHIQPRFYFGKHVGMFINLAYIHYSYNHMDFTNTFTRLDDVVSLNGGGVNFGLGIQGKF